MSEHKHEGRFLDLWCNHLHEGTEFRCIKLIGEPVTDVDTGAVYLCRLCQRAAMKEGKHLWEFDLYQVCEQCVDERRPLLTVSMEIDSRKDE